MNPNLKEFLEETLESIIEQEKLDKEILGDMYDPNCYGTGYNVGQMSLIREILENFDLMGNGDEK